MTIMDVVNSIVFLLPDAKFCVRTTMSEDDYKAAGFCNETVYPFDEFFILWSSSNSNPMPSLDAIRAVTNNQRKNVVEKGRKFARNLLAKDNLAIVANFKVAKQANPQLKFGAYLDSLETDASDIDTSA